MYTSMPTKRRTLTTLTIILIVGVISAANFRSHSHKQLLSPPTDKEIVRILRDIPANAPTLFQASETVQPGDTMNIQGSGFNLSASAWLQLVKSDGTLDSTQLRQIKIANQSTYLIQAVVPADMPAGMWATWIQNGATTSNILYVHQARATGYDFKEVAPGNPLRVWGRNLVPPGGDYHTAYATFTNGSTTVTAPATAGDAYSLTITTPAGLTPGTVYTVNVSNGLGSTRGQSLVPVPLTIRSAGPDVWNLGVPWAADFTFSANEYNVETDVRLSLHAVGDGITDDLPAIQAAATYAHTHGGGVVYLPSGTYYLDNTSTSLTIDSQTVLKGNGPGNTTLTYGKNAGSDMNNAVIFPNVSQVGLLNLSFQNLNTRTTRNGSTDNSNLSATPTSEVFFKNISWQMGGYTEPILGYYDKFLIADSTLSTTSKEYSPLYIRSNDTTIKGNTLFSGIGREIIHGANLVIENNTLTVDGNANNPFVGETGGLELSYSSNVAVRGNTIQVTGTTNHSVNDLEMILTQSAEIRLSILGTPSSASSSSLSDTTKDWSSNTSFDPNPVLSYPYRNDIDNIVAIISGTGMGQWRSITAHDLHSITLGRPWDVIPDTTSGYEITRWTADRMSIINNTIINGSEGVDLYSGANDTVVANNTITNSGGIGLYGLEHHHVSVSQTDPTYEEHYLGWNNLITNNTVTNTNGLVAAKIWINLEEWEGVNARGNVLLSNEIRNNSLIAHTPNTVGQGQLGYENYEGFYDSLHYYLTNEDPGLIGVIGTIWENNSAQNVSARPQLNLGSSQMTVHYAGEPSTQPCLNLSLANRSAGSQATTGIDLKYFQPGTSTLVARTENWPSLANGTTKIPDPNISTLLNDAATYDVWVKAQGFLARKISGVTHPLTVCVPMAQGLLTGDFDGNNSITLSDLVTSIRAFNLGTDAKATLANTAFGHTATLSDLVTLIRNYNQTPNGDAP